MSKNHKRMNKELQIIYMCAFRFVIRRVTSMAGIIMEEIEKVRDSMDFFYLCQIECETRYAFEQGLVDECWEDKWEKFADELNEYLIEREKQEQKK